MIKVKFRNENISFVVFTEDSKIGNVIKNLLTGKASVSNDIPITLMKKIIDSYCPKLKQIMNGI